LIKDTKTGHLENKKERNIIVDWNITIKLKRKGSIQTDRKIDIKTGKLGRKDKKKKETKKITGNKDKIKSKIDKEMMTNW
jgi:hypothetical protein